MKNRFPWPRRIGAGCKALRLAVTLFPMILQALDWQPGIGFRSAALAVNGAGRSGLTLMPPASTGIQFANTLSEQRHLTNQMLLNGSGVALGDVDGDGWCDVYLCRMEGPNILYRNLGNWKFETLDDSAEIACVGQYSTGAAFADLDGDGDLDLIVNSVGEGTRIFINDGRAHFALREIVNKGKGGTSLALGDVDGDGYPDLYITNYRTSALMDMPNARAVFKTVDGRPALDRINGRPITDPDLTNRFELDAQGRVVELGEPDAFYHNAGGANFTLVPFEGGRFLDEDGRPLQAPLYEWGLSVMVRDINQDGLPDLYVCNDFASPDRLWLNQGSGTFHAPPALALRHTSHFSMGVDFADVNRDGLDEFFVLDMLSRDHRRRMIQEISPPVQPSKVTSADRPQYGFNTLFLNQGDGTYAEIARLSRVDAAEWAWGAIFLDVDLDGYEDLLISNGQERATLDRDVTEHLKRLRAIKRMTDMEIFRERRAYPRWATSNIAFRNRGDLTFEDRTGEWGFENRSVSHGMALGDLDNDGDLDVVVNNFNEVAGVYRNEGSGARVAVRLKGEGPNTRGIGAKVWVYGGAVPAQSQEMISGGRYLSSDDPMRVFAAGSPANEMRIEVRWRSGKRSVVNGVKGNRVYEIDEAAAAADPAIKVESPAPVFEDASDRLRHVHWDEEFDDFVRQPLLPRKLSHGGPGVSWFDVDGDGREDLILGSGRGGRPGVYMNEGNGGFKAFNDGIEDVAKDQTGVLGWTEGANRLIVTGSSNYEDGATNGGCLRIYDLKRGVIGESVFGEGFSVGPLALGDADGDGDLDLFVGGRAKPGRYPESVDSLIMKNEAGRFEPGSRLEKVGMVSGAVWSDLDGDGLPELVLACEWGPIRVFRNERGSYREVTKELGFDPYGGWWNGVTSGDFDGDGRMDLVAGNWGRNTPYESHRERELKVYFGDLAGSGGVEVLEAYYSMEMGKEVPERSLEVIERWLPWVRERLGTHAAYGQAGVEEILGERNKGAGEWRAAWLETMVFMNRGDRFEGRVLPVEAQMSPAFGVCVGDYDGDGKEDVFMSQNFFGVRPEDGRYDGGRGLWLKGDGKGGFRAVPGWESGVKVYGEGRGSALCDYDADGRVDLVVGQNQAETKLYRNVGAKPGLRVRLIGPAGNPTGVGAVMRLRFGERWGPAREVHAGSGYWSQDSAVQVLGTPDAPTAVWVRWPGGKTTTSPVPAGAAEVEVNLIGMEAVP